MYWFISIHRLAEKISYDMSNVIITLTLPIYETIDIIPNQKPKLKLIMETQVAINDKFD